ncbi:MAG: protein-glutamate O-methyltransferase CheR [Bacillota bacterium]
MENLAQITDEEYWLIKNLVYDRFGINLGEHKRALVIARLQKVLHTGRFLSFKDYYDHVMRDPSAQSLLTLIDRISTNHTYFFREKEHFEFFKTTLLPQVREISRKSKPDVRIWSAGCSSGEEPYTLAMITSDYFGDDFSGIEVGILATDISVSALQKAEEGEYPAEKMSQVPVEFRQRYFTPLKNGNWAVKKNLKDIVLFRRLNLMRNEYPFKGRFQAIFCRNVMIYFDNAVRQELIKRFHRYIEPGGYLFIGQSESLDRSSGVFKYVKPSIYQKV